MLTAIGRGNLELALDLYRKAETYVPDNIKLKERYVLFSSLTTATAIYVVMMFVTNACLLRCFGLLFGDLTGSSRLSGQ